MRDDGPRIVLLSDSPPAARSLQAGLLRLGLRVHVLPLRARAAAPFRGSDALLLEASSVPDSLSSCERMRREAGTRSLPILVLTPRRADEPATTLAFFAAGADECAAAGTDLRIIAAQLRALVRRYARSAASAPARLQVGRLRLDYSSWSSSFRSKRARLTPKEFAILEKLMLRAGSVVPRGELMDCIRRSFEDTTAHALETHIANLRSKLGRGLIETLPGIGYLLASSSRARGSP